MHLMKVKTQINNLEIPSSFAYQQRKEKHVPLLLVHFGLGGHLQAIE